MALRRQSLAALAVAADVIAESKASGSSDIEWDGVVAVSVILALLCLSPVAFASTAHSYRLAATVVAVVLTVAAVHGITTGDLYPIPAAVFAWLTTLPIRGVHVTPAKSGSA